MKNIFQPGMIVGVNYTQEEKVMKGLRPCVILASYWKGNTYKIVPLTSSMTRYDDYDARISKSTNHLFIESTDSLARLDAIATVDISMLVYPYFKNGEIMSSVSKGELLAIHQRIQSIDCVHELELEVMKINSEILFQQSDEIEFRYDKFPALVTASVLDVDDEGIVELYIKSFIGKAPFLPGSRILIESEQLKNMLTHDSLEKLFNRQEQLSAKVNI